MTEQQPEVETGYGSEQAEDNGFADQARDIAADDATSPPDEASSPA